MQGRLCELPAELSMPDQLEDLRLVHSYLERLPAVLATASSLTRLCLHCHRLQLTADDVSGILAHLPRLQVLDLSCAGPLSDDAAARASELCPRLQVVRRS
ncbi:hypothetical protein ABPG75_003182 [Micractinium tetrahymenae]